MFKSLFFTCYVFTVFNLYTCPEIEDEVKTSIKEHYRLKLKRISSDLSELLELGDKLCEEKKYSEAIRAFNDAVVIFGETHEDTYQRRAKCYAKMGNTKLAIWNFEKAIKHQAVEGPTRRLLVKMLLDIEDYDSAIEHTLHLYQCDITELAHKFCSMGKLEKAMEVYKGLIIKFPYPESYIARGNCRAQVGNMDEALSDFEKAADLDKNLPEEQKPGYSRVLLSLALFDLGKMNTKELSSLDDCQLMTLANKLIDRGRNDDSITCLSIAIDNYPKNAELYRRRAYVHSMKLDRPSAILDYRRTVELDPSDIDSRLNLMDALIHEGNYLEAKRNLEAIDSNSKDFKLQEGRSSRLQKIRETLKVKLEVE